MIHILLSTYNGERYLAEQLDSILAQTYTDWRLFIRDDGSTDGTMRVLKEYADADKRIELIVDGENIGACRSFERLLSQCAGAGYYAFADQDDVWKSDKLAVCLEEMHRQEQIHPGMPIVVHTDLQVVDEQLTEIATSFWQYGGICPAILDDNIHFLAICNSVTGCAVLMNAIARKVVLPFPPRVFMHDAWTGLRVLAEGGVVVPIYQTTICYRQHRDNVCGAQRYRFRLSNLREKRVLAERSYQTGKSIVFRNRVHFLWWKMIYFIVLHTYRLRHRT